MRSAQRLVATRQRRDLDTHERAALGHDRLLAGPGAEMTMIVDIGFQRIEPLVLLGPGQVQQAFLGDPEHAGFGALPLELVIFQNDPPARIE